MSYKLRIILDVKEDVFRDIYIDEYIHLNELHQIIIKSFGFNSNEMASFYRTDNEWNQGEEIPLENISEDGICMEDVSVHDIFQSKEDKLIYVYDFFAMWTFFIEVLKLDSSKEDDLPIVSLSVGKIPEKAPEKNFTASNDFLDFENDFEDNFNEEDFI